VQRYRNEHAAKLRSTHPARYGHFASVPMPDVDGTQQLVHLPGVGLGAIASGTRRITDEMFMSAALTLARLVTEADLAQGSLYPALPRIREVSAHIAAAIVQVAYNRGLAVGQEPEDMLLHVRSQMYEPRYYSYV